MGVLVYASFCCHGYYILLSRLGVLTRCLGLGTHRVAMVTTSLVSTGSSSVALGVGAPQRYGWELVNLGDEHP